MIGVRFRGLGTVREIRPIPASRDYSHLRSESVGLTRNDPAIIPRLEAREINNAGQVEGWSEEMYLIDPEHGHNITNRAFMWDPVNGTTDLNAMMGLEPDEANQMPLSYALDVNNAGQIVGFGTQGGWILTLVPEPGGAVSSLVGLWVLGISRGAGRARVRHNA